MKTLISIYGHIYVGHLIVEINELFWKGLTILSMGNHVYWSWVARLKTQNSRKCWNAQKFSTTPMSPKKRSSYSLRCKKVSKTPFKIALSNIILYYLLKGSFSRDFTYSAFSLWLCSSERIRGIHGNSKFFTQFQRFLSRSDLKIWHYTDFRNLKWIPLRCFCVKTPQLPGF